MDLCIFKQTPRLGAAQALLLRVALRVWNWERNKLADFLYFQTTDCKMCDNAERVGTCLRLLKSEKPES